MDEFGGGQLAMLDQALKDIYLKLATLSPELYGQKVKLGSNRTSKNEMRGLFPGASSFRYTKTRATN